MSISILCFQHVVHNSTPLTFNSSRNEVPLYILCKLTGIYQENCSLLQQHKVGYLLPSQHAVRLSEIFRYQIINQCPYITAFPLQNNKGFAIRMSSSINPRNNSLSKGKKSEENTMEPNQRAITMALLHNVIVKSPHLLSHLPRKLTKIQTCAAASS